MNFKEIINFRHACKLFDENKKISKDEIDEILKETILAPSSFGIEGWKLLVITNQKLKERLRPFCWNQPQITTCSHLIVILYRKSMKSSDEWVQNSLKRRGELFEKYIKTYANFIDIRSQKEIECWSKNQSYILSAFLMLSAASKGIDSCPIEGFEYQKVIDLLEFDKENYDISYLVALGYRVKEQPNHIRYPLEKIVDFVE